MTPFELELALTGKAWTGDYLLDFAALLESSTFGQDAGTLASEGGEQDDEDAQDDEDDDDDGERPVFSATTGTYRHPKRYTHKDFSGASSWHLLPRVASALTRLPRRRLGTQLRRVGALPAVPVVGHLARARLCGGGVHRGEEDLQGAGAALWDG